MKSSLPQQVQATWVTLRRRTATAAVRAPQPLRQTYRLIRRTARQSRDDRLPGLAAEAALFTLISLPALLLAIVGSLGYVAAALGSQGTEELRELVLVVPRSFLGENTFSSYEQSVNTVLASTHGGVVSVSIVLSVWTGSRAVNRYLETMTIAYGVEPRPIWRRRLLAVGLTIGGLLAAVAILPPMVLGPQLIRWLAPDAVAEATLATLDTLFWPSVVLAVLAGLVSVYHLGVPSKTPWRRDVPGALLAMALWLLASAALRTYLNMSGRNEAVFSQLAVPIAVVLWLYITAFAVLLGAEFNAAIEKTWPHHRYPWSLRSLIRRRRTVPDGGVSQPG